MNLRHRLLAVAALVTVTVAASAQNYPVTRYNQVRQKSVQSAENAE